MKIILDHDIPAQIRRYLQGHLAMTAKSLGWSALSNGELIGAAERASFEVLLTGDQKIHYQQNNFKRQIALLVVTRTDRQGLESYVDEIRSSLARVIPGGYELLKLPPKERIRRRYGATKPSETGSGGER